MMHEPMEWGGSWSLPSKGAQAVSRPDIEAKRTDLLALLLHCSYQVDEPIIQAFRIDRPGGDWDLAGALAWSSSTAARRVGSWLCGSLSAGAGSFGGSR